jgi:hypothetical protein
VPEKEKLLRREALREFVAAGVRTRPGIGYI